MRVNWKTLAIALAIPLAVGGVSALVTRGAMEDFSRLNQPPLSPPGWLFPIVWTVLFLLMGLASYLVVTGNAPDGVTRRALTVYGIQLGVNFLWSILFFNLQWYLFSFFWLVLLWGLILVTMILFFPIRKPAGWLMVPYILWVTFAGYLNFGIYFLN
ncbi:MAG: tryptophan-rich sensory protein [Ruminiclostridium sp.]|nr:tryptophan-rich sensory protein [Ruminiclostridium sp.]